MANVVLSQVDKFYGRTQALRDVSLEIKNGEFAVFVGPSGCGKSTLLRAIAELEDIHQGTVAIDDIDVTAKAPSERNVSMVFQSYALYPHMSVFDNMAFGMKVNGVKAPERKERVHTAARILRLEEYLQRKPSQLSGGQRQRVAIGRAIVKNPKVFLFDEPLSNLDAKLRVQMRIELQALHDQLGSTMIYVTHDQVEAMTMADRIVVLNEGVIEQTGTPMELYHKPATEFVADFLGSPSMNIIEVETRENSVYLGRDKLISYSNEATPAKFGIRPEHIRIGEAHKGRVDVQVTVRESLGGEAYLYTKHTGSDATFVIKTDGMDNYQAGDLISLEFSESHMHFFNGKGTAIWAD